MSEKARQHVTSKVGVPHPVLRIVIPILILALGIGLATVLVITKRPPRKRPAKERAAIVEVQLLERSSESIKIETAGTVAPREAVPFQARVGGEIVAINPRFVPGGRFAKGEVVITIDPTDYRLEVTNRHAALLKAEANLDLELGLQDVARHEWETMRKMDEQSAAYTEHDEQLALRSPQLRLARSAVSSAGAALERAMLDLDRTRVRAPFNAVIRARHVNVGTQVSSQTTLAELAGTDAYWVMVTLSAADARWISLPDPLNEQPGALAIVSPAAGTESTAEWQGRVIQRLPDLEPRGRQAQLIVEVSDPRNPIRGSGQLQLGSYVRVTIDGPTLDEVFSIPRSALRDGRLAWLMNDQGRLATREVIPVWSNRKHALVREGLSSGERLIVTDISVPLSGMLLKIAKGAPAETMQGKGSQR